MAGHLASTTQATASVVAVLSCAATAVCGMLIRKQCSRGKSGSAWTMSRGRQQGLSQPVAQGLSPRIRDYYTVWDNERLAADGGGGGGGGGRGGGGGGLSQALVLESTETTLWVL